MGTFEYVKIELTVAECDKIALEGGCVASYGFGYDCPLAYQANNDYDVIVVNKQGMGNHGFQILRGRTPRARALLREGKANQLATKFNVPLDFARHAVNHVYAFEVTSLAWSIHTLLQKEGWVLAKNVEKANSHKELRALLGKTYQEGFSFWRYQSAIKIALTA